jgi:hypothetical protein
MLQPILVGITLKNIDEFFKKWIVIDFWNDDIMFVMHK